MFEQITGLKLKHKCTVESINLRLLVKWKIKNAKVFTILICFPLSDWSGWSV